MDQAKVRFAAGVGAAIFGVVGTGLLSVGLVFALEPVIGWTLSLCTVGGGFFLIAAAFLVVLTQPGTSTEEEIDNIESITAETLAELPFDTIAAAFEKRPLASMAVAATIGYVLIKQPKSAIFHASRLFSGLL